MLFNGEKPGGIMELDHTTGSCCKCAEAKGGNVLKRVKFADIISMSLEFWIDTHMSGLLDIMASTLD